MAIRVRTSLRQWWRADEGSATAELAVITPALVMLLVFVAVVVHRGVGARLRIDDAAHQAARAASISRTTDTARSSAYEVAAAALANAGSMCRDLAVDVDAAAMRPAGVVRATVSCRVDLGDALLLGVAGDRLLTASALEPVDTFRGGGAP
jgi:Flp pilus assembly protein TadG